MACRFRGSRREVWLRGILTPALPPEPSQGFKAVQGWEWLLRERFESMGDHFLVQGLKARILSGNILPVERGRGPRPLIRSVSRRVRYIWPLRGPAATNAAAGTTITTCVQRDPLSPQRAGVRGEIHRTLRLGGKVTGFSAIHHRCTRAPPPFMSFSTSALSAIEVSPGVVMASAPWAAPYSTAFWASPVVIRP